MKLLRHVSIKAVMWENGDNPQVLGTLQGMTDSAAYAISYDGDVVLGSSWIRYSSPSRLNKYSSSYTPLNFNPSYHDTFIWTKESGMIGLKDIFPKKSIPEKQLEGASTISADGTIIAGHRGDYLTGKAIWKAYIPRLDVFANEGIRLPFLENLLSKTVA